MKPKASKFSPAADQFIRKHYLNDMTAREIGAALGETKGAVAGRAELLGLCGKKKVDLPWDRAGARTSPNTSRTCAPCQTGAPLPQPAVGAARIDWRPKTCQWIEGAPSADDACKCGDPVQADSSYCPVHHVLAWRGGWAA